MPLLRLMPPPSELHWWSSQSESAPVPGQLDIWSRSVRTEIAAANVNQDLPPFKNSRAETSVSAAKHLQLSSDRCVSHQLSHKCCLLFASHTSSSSYCPSLPNVRSAVSLTKHEKTGGSFGLSRVTREMWKWWGEKRKVSFSNIVYIHRDIKYALRSSVGSTMN